jgi:hypothetical protein
VGSTTYSTDTTGTAVSYIGGFPSAHSLNGFISDLRVIKGTALYTSNFTPPTTELTNVTNTTLLCCQSTTSAGAAAVSPNISGLNDGRVFSVNLTTNYGPVVNPSYAFNGVTDLNESVTGAFAASTAADISSTPAELSVTFSPAIPCTSSLRITSYDGGAGETIQYRVNNGSWTTIGDGSAAYEIFDIFAGVTGNQVTEVGIRRQKGNTNAGNVQLGMIEVDGTILLDPVASFEDAAATTYNPLDAFSVDGTGYSTAAAAGLSGGDITPTGASVGTKQGFSIIKFTGSGSGTPSIPHGLSEAPTFIIQKDTGATTSWRAFAYDGSTWKIGNLNNTDAFVSATETAPTSSLFYANGNGNAANTQIAYLWHDVPGLQKFGLYEGNENADGTYVELGFRPALICVKNIDNSSGHWVIVDKERDPINVLGRKLAANLSNAELLGGPFRAECDFLSNGFKMRGTSTDSSGMNKSDTYIYAAWAEAPEFNLYGAQSNAR